MDSQEVINILKKVDAFKEGHFLFSSGLHGEVYIQCAQLLKEPPLAEKVCRELAQHFRKDKPEIVVGPAIGGIIVAYEVARALGVPGIFTERVDGEVQLRRMFEIKPGQRVLVVEDVVTTGLSSQEVVNLIEKLGGVVVGVGSLVDRSNGKARLSVPFYSLVKINVNNYEPEECPLCKKGIPLVKPGSRR